MKIKHLYLIKDGYAKLKKCVINKSVDEYACYKYLLGCRLFASGNDKKLLNFIIDYYCNDLDSFLNFDFSKYCYDLS